MKGGYKILWTPHALSELKKTIEYLEENWTRKELNNFSRDLDHVTELISKNSKLFQASSGKNKVRRAVVARFNILFYRIHNDSVEILSFFSNRQDPGKLKI